MCVGCTLIESWALGTIRPTDRPRHERKYFQELDQMDLKLGLVPLYVRLGDISCRATVKDSSELTKKCLSLVQIHVWDLDTQVKQRVTAFHFTCARYQNSFDIGN